MTKERSQFCLRCLALLIKEHDFFVLRTTLYLPCCHIGRFEDGRKGEKKKSIGTNCVSCLLDRISSITVLIADRTPLVPLPLDRTRSVVQALTELTTDNFDTANPITGGE